VNRKNVLSILWRWGRICIGCVLFAAGFQLFLQPNQISPGGVSGIAMVITYLTGAPTGVLIIVCNIPIFLLAWRALGRRFLIASVISMIVYSVFVDILEPVAFAITEDVLLAAVYGGALMGLGLGLVFSAGASTGGSDVVARLLALKFPHMNLGQLLLLVDVFVVLLSAVVFQSYEGALYAGIAIFMSSKVIDLILYGLNFAKVVYIISRNPDDLAKRITERLGRGVTILYGRGAYSGEEKEILLCAVAQRQIVELKRAAREADPEAFMIVSEAREVLGLGFQRNDN